MPSSPYAGRSNANSSEWPEYFTIPGIERVRPSVTGEPFTVGLQVTGWRQPWNFRPSYSLSHAELVPEELREPMVTPMWRETKITRAASLYGSATKEYQECVEHLQKEMPEMVYSDPNNPLRLQLIAERTQRRREEQRRQLASRVPISSRSSSSRSSSRRPPSSMNSPVNSSRSFYSIPESERPFTALDSKNSMTARCLQYNVSLPSELPLPTSTTQEVMGGGQGTIFGGAVGMRTLVEQGKFGDNNFKPYDSKRPPVPLIREVSPRDKKSATRTARKRHALQRAR